MHTTTHLDSAITAGRDNVRTVRYKDSQVDKRGVASKLLERLSGLESVDPDGHVVRGTEKLTTITRELKRCNSF